MCVILVCPKKVRPDRKTLEACHRANPHGAGVAWRENDEVRWLKGLDVAELAACCQNAPRRDRDPLPVGQRRGSHSRAVPSVPRHRQGHHPPVRPCPRRDLPQRDVVPLARRALNACPSTFAPTDRSATPASPPCWSTASVPTRSNACPVAGCSSSATSPCCTASGASGAACARATCSS